MSWGRSAATGALLGAAILGIGGRFAMRGVTLWEGRAHQFTLRGSLTVMAWGLGFGALAGLARPAAERWLPGSAITRRVVFMAAMLGIALVILTPLTVPRLVLFPPVVLFFLLALERANP